MAEYIRYRAVKTVTGAWQILGRNKEVFADVIYSESDAFLIAEKLNEAFDAGSDYGYETGRCAKYGYE